VKYDHGLRHDFCGILQRENKPSDGNIEDSVAKLGKSLPEPKRRKVAVVKGEINPFIPNHRLIIMISSDTDNNIYLSQAPEDHFMSA
jgi:hypothetical protein